LVAGGKEKPTLFALIQANGKQKRVEGGKYAWEVSEPYSTASEFSRRHVGGRPGRKRKIKGPNPPSGPQSK